MRNSGVLVIDQGTTSTRLSLFNHLGKVVSFFQARHAQYYPQPGWVEHDASEIWRNTRRLISRVLGTHKIEAIAIAHQGETALIWEPGKVLSKAIVWQDTRSEPWIEKLRKKDIAKKIVTITGLRPDAYFTAGKIRWLIQNTSLKSKNSVRVGTMDSWIIDQLSGNYVTDASTAARSLYYDIQRLCYDSDLLDEFGIPQAVLAPVIASDGDFGRVRSIHRKLDGVPIVASLVDQPASLFGHGCLKKGDAKATFGTGCFIYWNLGSESSLRSQSCLTTIAWQRGDSVTYALDGGIFAAGSVISWLSRTLNLSERKMIALPALYPVPMKLMSVPAFAGLAAPYWNRKTGASWMGIDLSTSPFDLVACAFHGIAVQVAQVIRAAQADLGETLKELTVDGGLSQSPFLMQRVSDLLGVPVRTAQEVESTSRGAALLALRKMGIWKDDTQIVKTRALSTYYPRWKSSQAERSISQFAETVEAIHGLTV